MSLVNIILQLDSSAFPPSFDADMVDRLTAELEAEIRRFNLAVDAIQEKYIAEFQERAGENVVLFPRRSG